MKKCIISAAMIVLAVGIIYSCAGRNYDNQFITQKGSYPVNNKEYKLKIYELDSNHIFYHVENKTGETILTCDLPFSPYQVFFFYWEAPKTQLWVIDWDLGASVWDCSKEGDCKQFYFKDLNARWIRTIPKKVYDECGSFQKEIPNGIMIEK